MSRKRLMWQLYPSFLAITILALLVVTWYSSSSLKNFYLDQTSNDLESRARLLLSTFSNRLIDGNYDQVDSLCVNLGHSSGTRITIILPSGEVIGDSEENPAEMDNHSKRPEVMEAYSGSKGESVRFSQTLQQNLMYVAIPVKKDDNVIGVIRTAIPITSIETTLNSIYTRIIFGGLLAAVLAAIISLYISRRISRPLEELKSGAERFAAGDLQYQLPVPNSQEIGSLAESMNQMATQLYDRINIVINQRNEQKAILSSMVEGVLAIDTEEKILTINNAAALLLGAEPQNVIGKTLQEIIRNTELQNTIMEIIKSGKTVEKEITIHAGGEKYLQVHGTILQDTNDTILGALVVLNDVTRIRRLESVRREFVANVSHELKTPVTSIKGFVETLMDGAIDEKDTAMNFLGIVARQADRLNAIIEDLLILSRVEQEAEKAEIKLNPEKVISVVKSALEVCELKAQQKNISFEIDCDNELTAKINAPLLEQAIINLVDNAIKQSNEGSVVFINCHKIDDEVKLSVVDHGCGIKKVHIPHLFERFYRVDKARSREGGGTGLGLAIVKHISLAHNGSVEVESIFGEGSTFTISINAV